MHQLEDPAAMREEEGWSVWSVWIVTTCYLSTHWFLSYSCIMVCNGVSLSVRVSHNTTHGMVLLMINRWSTDDQQRMITMMSSCALVMTQDGNSVGD